MNRSLTTILLLVAALAAPALAQTADEDLANEDRMGALERKVELLTDELARTRQDMGVPEDKPLESVWGLGPAASKVYGVAKGLSIGGYAETVYTDVIADKRKSNEEDTFDFVRAVLYTGYKFTDQWVFNAEFEFEHASTSSHEGSGGGSVSVEFATLDYLWRDEANLRAGLMLVPMGFLNEMHEPPFYYGNQRPVSEEVIIPTTFRENGAGVFGRIGEIIEYKAYAITSLNGAGFGASGLRGGRMRGNRANADDFSFVGALDVEPIPGLQVGGSTMVGNTGHDQRVAILPALGGGSLVLPAAHLFLWETHAQFQRYGLHVRALYTQALLQDARDLTLALRQTGDIGANEAIAKQMVGYYGEIAYEILQWLAPQSGWTVEPFARFERVDTQHDMPGGFAADRTKQMDILTAGISAKPIPNVVLKIDYRNKNPRRGSLGDEVNAGFGLVF
jgi:hypothetical protein